MVPTAEESLDIDVFSKGPAFQTYKTKTSVRVSRCNCYNCLSSIHLPAVQTPKQNSVNPHLAHPVPVPRIAKQPPKSVVKS